MSSRLEIEKICDWCSKHFIAKKTTTKYCSHECNSKAYKSIKRVEKIKNVGEQIRIQEYQKPLKQLKDREYFKIAEVALLLGLSVSAPANPSIDWALIDASLPSKDYGLWIRKVRCLPWWHSGGNRA